MCLDEWDERENVNLCTQYVVVGIIMGLYRDS